MTYKDKVILFNSQQAEKVRENQQPGTSHMIALACQDGSDVWKTALTPTRACYAVPGIYTDDAGKDQLISCNTGDGFFSLDPESGKKNWSTLPFRMRTVASTLIADGLVIGSNGSGGGGNYLVAIRPDKKGQKPPEKVYELKRANYVPSPVAVDGKLFLFTDKGIGQCFDLQTGDVHWQERIAKGFSGSPIATKDHIYVIDESGTLYVIETSEKYKLVSSHSLGEASRATPAVSNGHMFLRTESHLICVGEKK
jgi:outer membrane protein assembly factor BamB